jgi:Poly-adenylate binding protein, unique domain
VRALFDSDSYKSSAGDHKTRRDIIGNFIYQRVEIFVGEEAAPKVTGLLISLSDMELIPCISTLENLSEKAIFCKGYLDQIKQQQELISKGFPELPKHHEDNQVAVKVK